MRRPLCATVLALIVFGPVFAQNHPTRIYVYARRDTPARRWMPVSCDGAVVADVKAGFFFAINLDPGRYTVAVKNGVPATVDTGTDAVSFLRLDWNHGIGRDPIPVFSKVPENQARGEMRFLSYDDPKHVHSKRVPGADPDPPQPRLHRRDEH